MIDVIADDLDHPECVAYGLDGFVYAGGEAGQIYRIDVETRSPTIVGSTDGFILGIALDRDGNVYACDTKAKAVLRMSPSGDVETLCTGTPERPMRLPNSLAFGATGELYISDSGVWGESQGCIYRRSPDGAVEVWSEGAASFTNGIAHSPDGAFLYVVESTLPGVTRIPIQSNGSAGEPETVVMMPGTVPDGIAFDTAGRLYIACYRPDRLYRLDPTGELVIFADDPKGTAISAPTNVAFGGESMSSLFIASLGRWHVSRMTVDVPGFALHYPEPQSNASGVVNVNV
ncbi:SMP-30/gluconolactonase/LRE family protein [Glaciibacter psychrotolerans]|uniref:Gluconolactonase n=1 Tax=Glaciibacter psychrotolerans TaxID=670054 RepID=A0A7Z0EIV5_9MICO|nr:SMP-30/gluconolactonase/LRE family protein [Leifsonia psychrotolerans]NYJ21659.1 gluconolactonase [Leifsonia psychrotolerans]